MEIIKKFINPSTSKSKPKDKVIVQKQEKKYENQKQQQTKIKSINLKQNIPSLKQRYTACMVLSAIGDAMGYKNGDWQFNTSPKIIHDQMMKLTKNLGPQHLEINFSWRYSDDTVMHIATAKALINQAKNINNLNKVAQQIAIYYKKSGKLMSGRAPGKTCMKSIQILNDDGSNWNKIPHNPRAAGCGASMRSACIGLVYHKPQQVKNLIAVSIQAGRITHHNPIGYLGSMVSSYFTSLAIQRIQPKLWVAYLFEQAFPLSYEYIKQANRQVELNIGGQDWKRFQNDWKKYAEVRKLSVKLTGNQQNKNQYPQPFFPQKYDLIERQRFYKTIATGSWPGATGLDSVLISYDALLGCGGSWNEFCLRGVLHGGDNDSTGAIGGAWFGALYGLSNIPQKHYKSSQDIKKLTQLGQMLYKISQ